MQVKIIDDSQVEVKLNTLRVIKTCLRRVSPGLEVINDIDEVWQGSEDKSEVGEAILIRVDGRAVFYLQPLGLCAAADCTTHLDHAGFCEAHRASPAPRASQLAALLAELDEIKF